MEQFTWIKFYKVEVEGKGCLIYMWKFSIRSVPVNLVIISHWKPLFRRFTMETACTQYFVPCMLYPLPSTLYSVVCTLYHIPDDKYSEGHTLRAVHQHGQGVLVVLVGQHRYVTHDGGQEVDLKYYLMNLHFIFVFIHEKDGPQINFEFSIT